MVSKEEIKEVLVHHATPPARVLSVYLEVDQARAENLRQGFLTALRNALRTVSESVPAQEREQFERNAEAVIGFVSEYSPGGKSIVIFANIEEEFFWHRTLRVSCGNSAYWNSRPYVRPLMEAGDEYERYGVILTDRQQSRLFTINLGEIEEDRSAVAAAEVSRRGSPGRQRLLSEMTLQRRAEEHAKWHFKAVAAQMDQMYDDKPFDRLLLSGPTEAVNELYTVLSKRLQERVAGMLSLPLYAQEQDIMDACRTVTRQREREDEMAFFERLRTGAGKGQQAVLSLEDTLRAAMEQRIQTLAYADNYAAEGSECMACGWLYPRRVEICEICGGTVEPVIALVERLVERVTDNDGDVEVLRDEAAERIRSLGGIGAILRF